MLYILRAVVLHVAFITNHCRTILLLLHFSDTRRSHNQGFTFHRYAQRVLCQLTVIFTLTIYSSIVMLYR
jgi:hypothetical protein